jgi:DUF1680 family protein
MPPGKVSLLPGLFQQRAEVNRRYLLSLRSESLLQNHYLEAGLWSVPDRPEDCHWGWESPTCQLRGHFLGHWLSAAAHLFANTGDLELKGKADRIVSELGRCQRENGGEWAGSIPEKYLDWIARGKKVWAPHYTLHKTLLGLYEMASLAGNEQAFEILLRWAGWFYRWTGQFSRQQMDALLEVETGGMMELWADLYALTGQAEHLELMRRYERRRFFDALLSGGDALTSQHANTRIPEVHGAARAWEVTGESRWRQVVEAFWRSAVTERGSFCTGGQTDGEIWTPPGELACHLSQKNQEHCTVYNMLRLADYLFRWSGDAAYADYWERNCYNGLLAQQHPETGMVAYFLPLKAGSVKKWSTPTASFWCCLGTLVQAHACYENNIFFEDDDGLVISQAIPSQVTWERSGARIFMRLEAAEPLAPNRGPGGRAFLLRIHCDHPVEFTVKVRIPWWANGQVVIQAAGQDRSPQEVRSGWASIHRAWEEDIVSIDLPSRLAVCSLPDAPEMVAFLDGPAVLAGLASQEILLEGDPEDPQTMIAAVDELEWYEHRQGFRSRVSPHGVRFLPLYEVRDETYSVYFPIRQPSSNPDLPTRSFSE